MNRIDQKIAQLQAEGRKMLSPYITAGDPQPDLTIQLMHALAAAGADILEIGLPFSDPMAEGPVIQQAMERALLHQVTTKAVLDMVASFRKTNQETPIVLMGYLNPVEQYGYEQFAKDAKRAGIDGTILVDLSPEESAEISVIWRREGLYSIYLCSPTTSNERMQVINALADGYLYYVSLKGVTGSNLLDLPVLKAQYEERKAQATLPLMVGFGIKTPDMAAEIAKFADGVIVGAALITEITQAYNANQNPLDAAGALISAMRQAIDQ